MPASSLFLISLQPSTPIPTFIPLLLASSAPRPILIARPLRWIIYPWISDASPPEKSSLETLASTAWDLLVIFPTAVSLPAALTSSHIQATYTLTAGISSKLIANFTRTNAQLLHPTSAPPPLTGSLDKANSPSSSSSSSSSSLSSSSDDLALTPDLLSWFTQPSTPRTPISMLNLLAFHEGKLESYKAYGKAFATEVGRRRGGVAKVVGTVLTDDEQGQDRVWDEIAVAHYPSVLHFADMAASDDYQRVNKEHRIGALRGTTILCCDELDPEVKKGLENAAVQRAKM